MEVNFLWYAKDALIGIVLALAGLAAMAVGVLSWRRPEHWLANPRLRLLAGNLVIAGLSMVFVLGIAEVALRLLQAPDPLWTRADAVLHHVQVPGIETRFRTAEWDTGVRINSVGLRDDEVGEKLKDTLRVLALGDSFTWGFGVESDESWVSLLDRSLREHGKAVEVVNGGVPSYSPMLEYLYLENHGMALEPDVVLVAFDMSDLQDDLIYEQTATWDEQGDLMSVRGEVSGGKARRLFKSSTILKLLRSVFDQVYARMRSGEELSMPQHRDLHYNRFALTRDDVPEELSEEHWQRSLAYLDRIHQWAEHNGVHMILVCYPYGHQASTVEWREGRHHYGFGAEVVYGDHPARRLGHFAEERGTVFVSLFEAFREAADGSLYFPGDGHFTVVGHELAAGVLEEQLSEYLVSLTEPSPVEPE